MKIALPLLLGVFFVVYSIAGSSPEERHKLWENILAADPFWLGMATFGGFVSHLSRAYRWKFLIEPLGYTLRFKNSIMAVMTAYLANLGIPRSGEFLRAGTVSAYEGIPFEKSFGTIISERVADLAMLLLVIGLTFLLNGDELMDFIDQKDVSPFTSIATLLLLLALGVLGIYLVRKSKWKIFEKIRDLLTGLLEGMKSILKMEKNGAFILHTLIIWTLYIGMFFLSGLAVPGISQLAFGPMLVAFVVGSFAISLTNGGLGVYPVAVGGVLMLFGVEQGPALAFGWVVWGTQTLLNLIVGGVSMVLLPILNKK